MSKEMGRPTFAEIDLKALGFNLKKLRDLIRGQRGEEIGASEMARWMETIPYEVFCAIGKRVPRVYREGQG